MHWNCIYLPKPIYMDTKHLDAKNRNFHVIICYLWMLGRLVVKYQVSIFLCYFFNCLAKNSFSLNFFVYTVCKIRIIIHKFKSISLTKKCALNWHPALKIGQSHPSAILSKVVYRNIFTKRFNLPSHILLELCSFDLFFK